MIRQFLFSVLLSAVLFLLPGNLLPVYGSDLTYYIPPVSNPRVYYNTVPSGPTIRPSGEDYGWFYRDGWRYRTEAGTYLRNGWEWIDGNHDGIAECYYFTPSGTIATSTFIDCFEVDRRGRWIIHHVPETLQQRTLDGWHRFNGMDSWFVRGWKAVRYITPENIFVDSHGQKIAKSTISPGKMARESKDGVVLAVQKSTQQLEVWDHGKLIRTFVITYGGNQGDKEVQGDRKTPEGEFFVCEKNPGSKYVRGLFINYPNNEDAERGLASGLISRSQYNSIVSANNEGRKPPYDTRLGGYIEFHGWRDPENNSNGCIELLDEEMIELYDLTPAGSKVFIYP